MVVPSHHESIYALVHLPSLVQIEPELHHNDSPTYTTLPCQALAWHRQSNTRIACLASVWHTGQECPTTSAEQSAHTHRCPHGNSASNLPTSSALRQMQHSFSAASASTKGPTARSASSACSASVPRLPCAGPSMLACRGVLEALWDDRGPPQTLRASRGDLQPESEPAIQSASR